MDLDNQYEYAVVAIKQAVEKVDTGLQKLVMRSYCLFIMGLGNMFLRIQEMVFGGQMQLRLFLAD